jgi:hypothetical protein
MMTQQESSGVPPWLNTVMKFLLRSPLHGLVSKYIMLITFKGRKSGKQYTTPVSYLREGDEVLLFTHGKWWKNLEGGAPATLRIQGRNYTGTGEPFTDTAVVAEGLARMLAHNRRDAKYYGVATYDDAGNPDPDEVRRGAEEAVMVRIALA